MEKNCLNIDISFKFPINTRTYGLLRGLYNESVFFSSIISRVRKQVVGFLQRLFLFDNN